MLYIYYITFFILCFVIGFIGLFGLLYTFGHRAGVTTIRSIVYTAFLYAGINSVVQFIMFLLSSMIFPLT